MLAKSTKLILIAYLLLGILGCITTSNPNSNPVRSLKINIDSSQREEFFTQMREFADKHSLEFVLSFYDSDEKIFLLEISGEDFMILASPVRSSPGKFDIDFFNKTSIPTPQQTVDELFKDLKNFLGEIQNITIEELL